MKRVELHVHTKYSYDCNTSFRDIIDVCLKRKIDVLAVCDHNEIEGALRLAQMAPFKVIIGEEILTTEGEIIGLFLQKFIPPGLPLSETIKRIKEQGGLTYLPHPFDRTTRKTAIAEEKIVDYLGQIDIIETFNGRTIVSEDNKKAVKLAKKYKKLVGVGSDAHTKYEFGRNYLEMSDFSNAQEFIKVLGGAKRKTSLLMPWVFLLTKWIRFRRKHGTLLNKKKYITGKSSCELCGGHRFFLVYKKRGRLTSEYRIADDSYGVHSQIVKCLDCGLVFVYPRDGDDKVLKRYVNFQDPEYEREREARKENQKRILGRINKLTRNKGKLLEVGCATGLFLEIAKKDGWDVFGVEPSTWAAEIASKEYRLPIFKGTLGKANLRKGSFDVVVCIDVIEHVASPRKLLQQINRVLKPRGVLCLVTPDGKSMMARLLKEKWWHVRPDHLYYFSKDTISSLLLANNFSVERIKRYGWTFSFDYWISRFRRITPSFYKLLMWFKKIPLLNYFTKKHYHINFRDSLELYCRRL